MYGECADEPGIGRSEHPPRGEHVELGLGSRFVLGLGLYLHASAAELSGEPFERRVSDGLLHGVHERQQVRRRQHAVAALGRELQDVRNPVLRRRALEELGADLVHRDVLEALAQPLPDFEQLEVLRIAD
jgi:hypothetical protein